MAEIILLTLLVGRLEKNPAGMGLSWPGICLGIKKGLIWSAAFGLAAAMTWLGLSVAGVNALRWVFPSMPASLPQVVAIYIVGGIIAPVAEEIFFRGIVYGFFRRWGIVPAIILSTLLFGFIHPANHPLPITQIVGGILFAFAYEREKNLTVPITIHSLGNLSIFSLPLVMHSPL
jgi:hypothetical protein